MAASPKLSIYPKGLPCPGFSVYEYYDKNNELFARRLSRTVLYTPISFSTKKSDLKESYFFLVNDIQKFIANNYHFRIPWLRWQLAYLLESQIFHPSAKRWRMYIRAVWKTITTGQSKLLQSFLHDREFFADFYGAEILSQVRYGKSLASLGEQQKAQILAWYVGRKRLPIDLMQRIILVKQKFLTENLVYRDYTSINPLNNEAYFIEAVQISIKQNGLLANEHLSNRGIFFTELKDSVVRIYTHFEPQWQRQVNSNAIQFFIEKKGYLPEKTKRLLLLPQIESAAVVISIKDGGIVAISGGNQIRQDNQFHRALYARRSVSSTIKPFWYALALDVLPLKANSIFLDQEVVWPDSRGNGWQPKNYYTGYWGPVTLKEALSFSINTVAVQLCQELGLPRLVALNEKIFPWPNHRILFPSIVEPSISLGTLELTPMELAQGYLTLANQGQFKRAESIRYIKIGNQLIYPATVSSSPETFSYHNQSPQIFSPEAAQIVRDILQSVLKEGTAAESGGKNLYQFAAGKTGSSPADSWFVGFTPHYLILTWAGFDKYKTGDEMLPLFTVVPYWVSLVQYAIKEYPNARFQNLSTLEYGYFCRGSETNANSCSKIRGLFRKNRN